MSICCAFRDGCVLSKTIRGPQGSAAAVLELWKLACDRASAIARRQQAKSLELRAALSLRRLLREHGRAEQTPRELAEVYSWFTEGFDTPDLQDARAFLELDGS